MWKLHAAFQNTEVSNTFRLLIIFLKKLPQRKKYAKISDILSNGIPPGGYTSMRTFSRQFSTGLQWALSWKSFRCSGTTVAPTPRRRRLRAWPGKLRAPACWAARTSLGRPPLPATWTGRARVAAGCADGRIPESRGDRWMSIPDLFCLIASCI